MPPPAAFYIVGGVVISVATVIALKELLYEPYIAPALERWAENYIARRREKRLRASTGQVDHTDEHGAQHQPAPPPPAATIKKRLGRLSKTSSLASSLELEAMGELLQPEDRRAGATGAKLSLSEFTLRKRKPGPYDHKPLPSSPTHIIADSTASSTPNSSFVARPPHLGAHSPPTTQPPLVDLSPVHRPSPPNPHLLDDPFIDDHMEMSFTSARSASILGSPPIDLVQLPMPPDAPSLHQQVMMSPFSDSLGLSASASASVSSLQSSANWSEVERHPVVGHETDEDEFASDFDRRGREHDVLSVSDISGME